MEPVTMVIAALAAGAGVGLQDAAATAVKDAYSALKATLADRFRGNPAAEAALLEHEADPQTWEAPLTRFVQEVGVDERLLTLARQVLDADGARSAKYTVQAETVQGLQQGDRNTQFNTFGG